MLFRRTRRWRQWGKAQGAAKFRDDSRCLSTPQRQRDYPVAPPSHPYRQPFLAFPSFISLGIDRDEDLGRGQSRFITSKPFLITLLNERAIRSRTLACGVFERCVLRKMTRLEQSNRSCSLAGPIQSRIFSVFRKGERLEATDDKRV